MGKSESMLLVAGVLVAIAFFFSKKKDEPTAPEPSPLPGAIKAAPGAIETPLPSVMAAPAPTQTLPAPSSALIDPLSPLGIGLGPLTPFVNAAASTAQTVASILPRKD